MASTAASWVRRSASDSPSTRHSTASRAQRVRVASPVGPGKGDPGADRRLGSGLVALRGEQRQAARLRPGAQRGQRLVRDARAAVEPRTGGANALLPACASAGRAACGGRSASKRSRYSGPPLSARCRTDLAAERLHADHGADDVAVDIEVAGPRRGDDLVHRLVDAVCTPWVGP